MPAKSKAQQRFMGMVHAYKKGELKGSEVSKDVKDAAKGMKKKTTKDYAKTKHKGLPNKVKKEALKTLIAKYGAKKVRETIMAVSPKSDKGYREPQNPGFEYDPEGVDEGFGGELKGKDRDKFEKARIENAEQLGYKATGTSDTKKQKLKMAHQLKETAKRDYKAEYKKFQSSTKSKKYRAELNQYNRKKGTYGNGDGKDASHKGGKIAGFEAESKNRGRAEKSRLKKESTIKNESAVSFWQDMFRPGSIPNQYISQLIKKKGVLPSKSHIKRIYRDNGNPKSTDLAKTFKALQKDKYIRKQGSLWKWESGYAWRTGKELEKEVSNPTSGIMMAHKKKKKYKKESVNEGKWNPNKIRIHTNKAIGYLKQAQKFAKEGQKGAAWQRIGDAKDELKIADKFLESVNEAPFSSPSQLPYSSKEAQIHIDKDLNMMSKHLGKASQQVIKIMMNGVKSGKYDAMDLVRGIKSGNVRATHYGERDFIQQLWNKVRDKFRRYSKRGKLR